MKSVLISIQPKWCELIASGKKMVEVRKTKPKLDVPFKCYIYCTKGEPLMKTTGNSCFIDKGYRQGENLYGLYELVNGKVIGEFVCNCIVGIKCDNAGQAAYNRKQNTCVSDDEIMEYANHGKVYYWHISDLVIYDEPKELDEFFHACDKPIGTDCAVCLDRRENKCKSIKRPPQSWCYVEGGE